MKKFLIAVLGIGLLVSCGKRGRLDYPPDRTYPRQYPAARQPAPRSVPETENIGAKTPGSVLEMQKMLETEE